MPEASGSGVADESDYSTFENKSGLADDMKFLASMPELCDVTFLVGDTREPVCAVKAVLAARSRLYFYFIIFFFQFDFFFILTLSALLFLPFKRGTFLLYIIYACRVFHKMLYQAPSPQRKKDPPARENKLRLFLKRSSEPLLNLQNAAQQVIKRVHFSNF